MGTESVDEPVEGRFRALAESLPQLVWTTDTKGRIDFANARWRAFAGDESFPCRSFMHLVHPDDLGCAFSGWSESVRQRVPFETEFGSAATMVFIGGSWRARGHSSSARASDGSVSVTTSKP